MRISILFTALFGVSLFLSCGSKNNTPVQTYNNDSITFYPVHEFISAEIRRIDNAPYFIYRTHIADNKTDSLPITIKQFDSLAAIFLKYDISDKNVKKYYKESAFNDESTHSITFSYSTTNKTLPVQSLDVLLNQETQSVKRVFLTLVENTKDSSYLYKLSWKANDNFSITKAVTTDKGEQTDHITVAWK